MPLTRSEHASIIRECCRDMPVNLLTGQLDSLRYRELPTLNLGSSPKFGIGFHQHPHSGRQPSSKVGPGMRPINLDEVYQGNSLWRFESFDKSGTKQEAEFTFDSNVPSPPQSSVPPDFESFNSPCSVDGTTTSTSGAGDGAVMIPCSSCGTFKQGKVLARLWPCHHPLCTTCINALVNASCNDPAPPKMVCFLCSQTVNGFDRPMAFEITYPRLSSKVKATPLAELINPLWCAEEPISTEPTNSEPPNQYNRGRVFRVAEEKWLPKSGSERCEGNTNFFDEQTFACVPPPFITRDPTSSCPCPIVRVDNIAWNQTVAGIREWLPEGVLPPPELCPLPIHILCTPTDGKTLSSCFIEARDLASAHFLVRSRHGSKVGGTRPCSVGLTSSEEFHSKVLGTDESQDAIWKTVGLLLKLCDPQVITSVKASERPFFHLMSLLEHYPHLPADAGTSNTPQTCGRWTRIHRMAIQRLMQCQNRIPDLMQILVLMLNTGVVSPYIDNLELSRFLSRLKIPLQYTPSLFNGRIFNSFSIPDKGAMYDPAH